MSFAVCITAVSPLRKEPDHKSEMTSQLLLGESALILEEEGKFIFVECLHDNYKGWCQRSQLVITDKITYTSKYSSSAIDTVLISGLPCRISIGTPVHEAPIQIGSFIIDSTEIKTLQDTAFTKVNIIALTSVFLNTPYLWGGRTIFGIDCSGFAQQLYKLLGKQLPRDAHQQAEKGDSIGFLQEAQCGDLAFFDNSEGFITHVGILLNNEEIIHASGCVRIDKIDHYGITNRDTGIRTHNLRIIKRYN